MSVKNGSTTLDAYSYDGLGRRTTENPGTLRDIYFSSAWQVVEEDVSGSMQDQYVWSPVYVDAIIERDTPSQRVYVQQDANWNVTALLNTSGTVVERYVYDPYGSVTFLNASWGTISGSAYGWIYLLQGGRLDAATSPQNFRNRDYSPTLGRWLRPDPLSYNAGDSSLYRYVSNEPIEQLDPGGTEPPRALRDPTPYFYYLYDSNDGLGLGHAGLLIGPVITIDGGTHFYYYSFGPGADWFLTWTFSTDNLTFVDYSSFQTAMQGIEFNKGHNYQSALPIPADPAQVAAAMKYFVSVYRQRWGPGALGIRPNCNNIVINAINSGRLYNPIQSGTYPKQTFALNQLQGLRPIPLQPQPPRPLDPLMNPLLFVAPNPPVIIRERPPSEKEPPHYGVVVNGRIAPLPIDPTVWSSRYKPGYDFQLKWMEK
jgi:RHS repeat-associated protein